MFKLIINDMHFSQNYLRFIKFSIACDFLLQSFNTRFGMPYYLKTFKKKSEIASIFKPFARVKYISFGHSIQVSYKN